MSYLSKHVKKSFSTIEISYQVKQKTEPRKLEKQTKKESNKFVYEKLKQKSNFIQIQTL